MSLVVATHNGPFHADDVLAWSLLTVFGSDPMTLVRTRDAAKLQAADMVFDVGGVLDPEQCRFDHHQATYTGDNSSAGMVLLWLEKTERVSPELAANLRHRLVDYVDDVDNGRRAPDANVPCFPSIVEALNSQAGTLEEFDEVFVQAAQLGEAYLRGLVAAFEAVARARSTVLAAMADAVERDSRVIYLAEYERWKPIYFAHDGETHPTDFVLFPSNDGTWRIVAIPPRLGDFSQKRSLPESWAGLSGDELTAVTGIAGSMFCHKNRFIAVFETRDNALEAIEVHGLG